MSGIGKWAFAISLLFVFSITAEYRVRLGGMLVHPYLVVLPLGMLFSNFKISQLPKKILIPGILFYFLFSLLCLRNNEPYSEIFKVGSSMLTFLFLAVSVKTEKDF